MDEAKEKSQNRSMWRDAAYPTRKRFYKCLYTSIEIELQKKKE